MFDLREHKGLIRRLVSEANKNDAIWHWSLKALSKTKASVLPADAASESCQKAP